MMISSVRQQFFHLSRRRFVLEERDECPAIQDLGCQALAHSRSQYRIAALLPLEAAGEEFLRALRSVAAVTDNSRAALRSAIRALITPLPLSEPRSPRMNLLVTGLRRMPSDVASTKARVPFSISNSRRKRRGMTTWPLTEK